MQLNPVPIAPARPQNVVPDVILQHVEEAAVLRGVRALLVRAPHVALHQLRRLDDRLAAHLDGVSIAGEFGKAACSEALEDPQTGQVFTATVRALEDGDMPMLNRLLALAEAMPETQSGLVSATGWVSARFLQGTVRELLHSPSAFRRRVGISACAMHQVDPGDALETALHDRDHRLRARALRSIGEAGRRDLLDICMDAMDGDDPACRLWAARSAVLLGERDKGIAVLGGLAAHEPEARPYVLPILLKVLAPAQAAAALKRLAQEPRALRLLVMGSGMAGDVACMPWLLKQMEDAKLARLAGEAFATITGLDLASQDLERKPPANFEAGPNDDPADDDVSMDEDEGLPWPDPGKIHAWWQDKQAGYQPGVRYFMGQPVALEHCRKVLRDACQRQRMAAAQYLCLLQPGTPLFPTSAPAWRQARWLNRMG
ncbi:TIGR02270 family protein [Pseudoduganella sp. HUAS MS19]